METKTLMCGKCVSCEGSINHFMGIDLCSECLKPSSNRRAAKLGDVFSYSWGYDQTNVNFYQVVALTSKSVKLREIKQNVTEDGFMCGKTVPLLSEFKENESVFTKRVYLYDGVPHVRMNYGSCELWNGKPENCSWYA